MKNKYIKTIASLVLLVAMTDAAIISIRIHGFYTRFIKQPETKTAMTVKLETKVKGTESKTRAHKEI